MTTEPKISQGQLNARWLRICGRTLSLMLGASLATAGFWLLVSGKADCCPLQALPHALVRAVGGGLVVGGGLLFITRTVRIGIAFLVIWALISMIPMAFYQGESPDCWLSRVVIAGLALNAGLLSLGDEKPGPKPTPILMWLIAFLYGTSGVLLWLRGR